jgi:Xaa-Pro aminopeptidase
MRKNVLAPILLLATTCAFVLATDTDDLKSRRRRAADSFGDGILMVHATSALDLAADGFRQDAVFYYLTGLENTVGAILAIDGRSRESWLFLPTRPPYSQSFPPEGVPGSDAVKRSGIEHVVDWSELESFLAKRGGSPIPLYYVPSRSVGDLPPNLNAPNAPRAPLWMAAISRKWPSFQLKEVGARVHALLDVQSPSEMVNVRAAAAATVQALMAGMQAIKPGVSQRTVEATVAYACWNAGAHGVGFWPWVLTGPNAVYPRPYASLTRYDHLNAIMKSGELVHLDVGCEFNHYFSNLGRTVPVSGRFSAEQRETWDIFVAAYDAGVTSLREGVTVDQVFEAWSSELLRHGATAKSVLARQAIDEWSRRDKVPYWVIHTMNLVLGDISGPLRAGTTIAFEPIASAGGQEFYLEDMFVITKNGAELLTPRVPYSAAEIEAAMRPSAQKP